METRQELLEGGLLGAPIDAEQLEHGVRPPHFSGGSVPAPAAEPRDALRLAEPRFGVAQGVQDLLQIVDVGARAEPRADGAVGGELRDLPAHVPAVCGVGAPQTEFELARRPAVRPPRHGLTRMSRVVSVRPRFVTRRLQRRHGVARGVTCPAICTGEPTVERGGRARRHFRVTS